MVLAMLLLLLLFLEKYTKLDFEDQPTQIWKLKAATCIRKLNSLSFNEEALYTAKWSRVDL